VGAYIKDAREAFKKTEHERMRTSRSSVRTHSEQPKQIEWKEVWSSVMAPVVSDVGNITEYHS